MPNWLKSEGVRVFSADEQDAFALLSGDHNPMHVDEVEARRTIYGRPVVHGIHILLWALATSLPKGSRLTRLKAQFRAPLAVGESLILRAKDEFTLELTSNAVVIAIIKPEYTSAPSSAAVVPDDVRSISRRPPSELHLEDLLGAKGLIDLCLDES